VPLTGVNSAPVGLCMIAPSLIQIDRAVLRCTWLFPSPFLILEPSSEHVGIKELFAAEGRGLEGQDAKPQGYAELQLRLRYARQTKRRY
jgi:hypothetical protein